MNRPTPYYLDEGEGEPVLLLHSGGMAHQEWNVHREAFRGFRVLVPDLPGHGRTPLEGDQLSSQQMVASVQACLDDAGVEAAHVVGSSMGGSIGLRLAVEQPDRVRRLVLFRIGFRRETKRVVEELALDDPDYWRSIGMAEWLSRIHEPQGGPQAWEDVVQRAARLPETDPTAYEIGTEKLEGISFPTLVAAGDRDPLIPVEEAVEMYRAIPECDLWILPHATHVVAARSWRREIFQTEVTRFLKGARRELDRP